jgi:fatty-acyl-CoA synthase
MMTDYPLHLVEAVIDHAHRDPDRTTLVFTADDGTESVVTTADLQRQMFAYAHVLAGNGVERGDVVLLAQPDNAELVPLFLGAIAIGATPCIFPCPTAKIDPTAYADRLLSAVTAIRPRAVAAPASVTAVLETIATGLRLLDPSRLQAEAAVSDASALSPLVSPKADDLAFIQLSSGSTGRQRPVPVTHLALVNLIRARNQAFGMTNRDVVVGWVPLYHDLGLVGGVATALLSGVPSVVLSPFHWLARPVALMDAIDRHHGTICTMPNFAFNYCVQRIKDEDMSGVNLEHWRVLCNAAEPVRPASFTAFATRFARWGFRAAAFVSAYGLAENTLTATATRLGETPRVDRINRRAFRERNVAQPESGSDDSLEFVSCGVALPEMDVQIRSQDRTVVSDRHVGEVVLKSQSMFGGYYGVPPEETETLRDGWLYTGDLGYLVDGELYLCGRKKDLIVVGGLNVYPEDIELAAARVEGLRPGRVVAFGVPDERFGSERIVVLAETRPEIRQPLERIAFEVRQRVRDAVDATVSQVEFVPPGWIAKTTSGKISRWANRSKWLERPVASPS